MIIKLLSLSIKEAFRSKFRNKNIFMNIFLGLIFLYFATSFVLLGFFLPEILSENFNDPLKAVNSYMLLYFAASLAIRFLAQSLPVISIKPLLHLPIAKSSIVNYLLIRSKYSVNNFLPVLFVVPFAIRISELGYSVSDSITWAFGILLFVMAVNYINFALKRSFADSISFFVATISIVATLGALEWFEIFSARLYFGDFLDALVINPILLIVPILLIAVFYAINYYRLISKLNLDDEVQNKTKINSLGNMDWANSLGDIAPYIKLDLKMIWRNKRPKGLLTMSALFLGYGLIFYPNPTYADMPYMLVFVAVFMTGIFTINFGQFIPSWDSAYYSLLMTQRTNLLTYVKSKFALMSVSVIIFFILTTPYVYFGWDIILLHLAGAIYNIGVNTLIILMLSSYNTKPIDLSKKATFNYQGTGIKQWLMVIPIIVLPSFLFWIGQSFYGFEGGVSILVIFGILGIVFHQKLILIVARQLAERKHKILDSFKED